MKLILIFLCFLSLYGCGDVAKSAHIYRVNDSELQFILNSVSDRLDKLESLRGDININGDLGITGVMISGTVPLDRMKKSRSFATNTTTIAVTSSGTTIVSLDLGVLSEGDVIIVSALSLMDKGATGGLTLLTLSNVGGIDSTTRTGSVGWHQAASDRGFFSTSDIMLVTKDANITLVLAGQSAGSNASAVSSNRAILALVLRGT